MAVLGIVAAFNLAGKPWREAYRRLSVCGCSTKWLSWKLPAD